MSAEVELRMLEGSEFQTVGAAMLKPREAKIVRTTPPSLFLISLRSKPPFNSPIGSGSAVNLSDFAP